MKFMFANKAVRVYAAKHEDQFKKFMDEAERQNKEFPGCMDAEQFVALTTKPDTDGNETVFCSVSNPAIVDDDGWAF